MIGVLALQGAFREHGTVLKRLGHSVREVRLVEDLAGLKALIIPGGESTTMTKLMHTYGFDQALPSFVAKGGALWGTCAGAIVVAKDIIGFSEQSTLNLLDISVARNDYGRQVSSFETEITLAQEPKPYRAFFIRAPRIMRVGEGVEVIAAYQQDPVMVRQGSVMATVFHPELTQDTRVHEYFLREVVGP